MANKPLLSAKFLGSAVAGVSAGSFEPQRSNAGYVVFQAKVFRAVLGAANPQTGGFADLQKITNDVSTILVLSVDKFDIPKSELNKTVLSWNNEKRAFPVSSENQSFSFTARDFVDIPTAELLDAWFSMVYNSYTGSIGMMRDYAFDATVVLVNHSTGKPSRVYALKNVYPSAIDNGDIDHNNSGFLNIEVTFEVGKIHRLTEEQMKKVGLPVKNIKLSAVPVPGN